MTLLSIDPGRGAKPSIGWATFGRGGDLLDKGELTFEQLAGKLRVPRNPSLFEVPSIFFGHLPITQIVIENFVNDPGVRRGGQTNGTSEVIGAVEILALQAKVPFTRRSRTVLPTAMQHFGYVQTTKHLPHADSAYLHGAEYLLEQKEKAREARLVELRKGAGHI